MTRFAIFMTCAASAALAACQPAATDQPAAPAAADQAAAKPTDAEAATIVDTVEATFNSGDAATIMAHYTNDAVFFDAVKPAPTSDHATAQKWTEDFAAMKLSGLQVPDRRIQVLDADTIVASGTANFTKSGGDVPAPVKLRYSNVYEKQADGRWLVVHEHLSLVPEAPAAPTPPSPSTTPAPAG